MGSDEEVPPTVGIGASAGGFEAFSRLLETLPDDTGMAFVFVQHLDPEHESQLSNLLADRNLMPITQVDDGDPLQPNHIYVIPPDKQLEVREGHLRLSERDRSPESGHHHTIDTLFTSLAEELGPRAVGVLLSGTLTDGVLGLKHIRAEGGTTLVQDPASAEFPDMPQAAISAGAADLVLDPAGIGEELGRLARHPYVRDAKTPERSSDTFDDDTLREVLSILSEDTGIDFEHYKETTVKRRIHRRMLATGSETLEDYRQLLEEDPSEADELSDEMLILVTEFFRDGEVWETLSDEVFPSLVEDATEDRPIRAWVPGCATGQEAYSVAIALQEALDHADSHRSFQVFGTDVSRDAIETAREGFYPASIEAEVPEHRLQRFFERADGGYRIKKSIRSNCIFSVHDLTSDPPFSNIDLVSCRNVIIYLDSVLQRRALGMFHYSLRPGGYLVLGSSESPGQASDLFTQAIDGAGVYEPRAVTTNAIHRFTGAPDQAFTRRIPTPDPQTDVQAHERRSRTDELLLDRYAPPAVVVNDDLEILEFKGSTGRFLEQPSGQATHHLLKRVRPELRTPVGQVLQAATNGQGPARETALLDTDDGSTKIAVEALPVQAPQAAGDHYLVVFETGVEDRRDGPTKRSLVSRLKERAWGVLEDDGGAKDERIAELEEELASTREYLESLIEDYEATTEELQSTNEEALSANEELQSTNEELETAKEELQSTNEELMTLNDELQERNEEIERINDDLRNLLNSVRLPIVMLSSDLSIRRFTPDAEDLLNLRDTDIERPLTDLNLPIDEADLKEVMLEVLDNLQVEEREIETPDGDIYQLRVQPYRTSDNKVDGVVLVFLSSDRIDETPDL